MSPLAADLSELPKAASKADQGFPPDSSPTFLRPFFDSLRARHEAEGERPHAVVGTRFRHSMAGGCAREIGYHALGLPGEPMDLAGIWVTQNGTDKHDHIQTVLGSAHGEDFVSEVPVRIEGFDASGNADGKLLQASGIDMDDDCGDIGPETTCWEHKNVGGFAFRMAIGERGAPQGPKQSHIIQGALNALGMGADLLVITYLSWEAISVQVAARKKISEEGRIAAQWTYTRDEWEPIARAEMARVEGILGLLDEGLLAARKHPDIPAKAVIVDPSTAQWTITDDDGTILNTGTTWACHYCSHQKLCATTASGRIPIESVQ